MLKVKSLIVSLFVLLFVFSSNIFGINEQEFDANIRVLQSYQNVDASTLFNAISHLEKSGNLKAIPYLISALKDKRFPYHFDAIHALACIGGDEALNFLRQLRIDLANKRRNHSISNEEYLNEEHHYIISQEAFVVAALYKLGDMRDIDFLYNLTKSDDKCLKYNVAIALGMVNNKKSKNLLYHILNNDKMDLPKCGAATALVELCDPDILCTIRDMIKRGEGPLECFEDLIKSGPHN